MPSVARSKVDTKDGLELRSPIFRMPVRTQPKHVRGNGARQCSDGRGHRQTGLKRDREQHLSDI